MLGLLYKVMKESLPALLDDPSKWDSLIVNKRKPHTYRVFTQIANHRLCLHKFDLCDKHEASFHPHPWPAAFTLLSGSYQMYLGHSKDRESDPVPVSDHILTPGSSYSIMLPLTWHMIVPLEPTYTVMINGEPWSEDIVHTKVRTTKGKDLDKMPQEELAAHLAQFKVFLKQWIELTGTLSTYKRLEAWDHPPKPEPKKETFPNTLRHRVSSFFKDKDKEKDEKKDIKQDQINNGNI